MLVTVSAIEQAYERLRGAVSHTPLQYDRFLSEKYQATVLLKREDLQKVRSFKLRGAYYAITQADPELTRRGVVCASAGNHAQGVAYTCQEQQIRAVIFMPTTTPQQKIAQVLFFGGDYVKIELVGDTFDAAAQAAKHFAKEQQMAFIAPFDDPNIIAGQGTVAVEMLADAEKTSNDRSGRGSDWRGRLDQRNRSLFERKATEDKSCWSRTCRGSLDASRL